MLRKCRDTAPDFPGAVLIRERLKPGYTLLDSLDGKDWLEQTASALPGTLEAQGAKLCQWSQVPILSLHRCAALLCHLRFRNHDIPFSTRSHHSVSFPENETPDHTGIKMCASGPVPLVAGRAGIRLRRLLPLSPKLAACMEWTAHECWVLVAMGSFDDGGDRRRRKLYFSSGTDGAVGPQDFVPQVWYSFSDRLTADPRQSWGAELGLIFEDVHFASKT